MRRRRTRPIGGLASKSSDYWLLVASNVTKSADLYEFRYSDTYRATTGCRQQEMDDYDYSDEYMLDYTYEHGNSDDFAPKETLEDVFQHCLKPTLVSVVAPIGKLLLGSLVFRLTTLLQGLPEFLLHGTSLGFGILILHVFFAQLYIFIVILGVFAYIALLITHWLNWHHKGPVAVFVVVIYMLVCESFLFEATAWHAIVGTQIIVAMKVISVGYDLDSGQQVTFPNLILFGGYCFGIGTTTFGPWVPMRDYVDAVKNPQLHLKQFKRLMICCSAAVLFLTTSTCWTRWIIPDSWGQISIWPLLFRDAFSFRCSHYFVCFVSEASATLSGLKSKLKVTSPLNIEFPRSLAAVVTNWNVPMHSWLYTYVFKVTRPFGKFIAIVTTYTASSMLHGLNFQIAAVLLSLGVFSYVEYELRKKLSDVYDACIGAKSCKETCSHKYKQNHILVRMTNITCMLLNVFHLMYLGQIFDGSPELEEEGYNLRHTMKKWGEVNFLGHWVFIVTLGCHLLI